MTSKTCLMTFSILRSPYGDIQVQEFDDRTPDVFLEAEKSKGFIDRAKPVEDIVWMTNYQKDWFGKQNWPIYVVWWVSEHHQPCWREACYRLEHLHDYGVTPYAFTFKQPFDAQNEPYVLCSGVNQENRDVTRMD